MGVDWFVGEMGEDFQKHWERHYPAFHEACVEQIWHPNDEALKTRIDELWKQLYPPYVCHRGTAVVDALGISYRACVDDKERQAMSPDMAYRLRFALLRRAAANKRKLKDPDLAEAYRDFLTMLEYAIQNRKPVFVSW